MKECSFFTDDRYPANRTACSVHGDRHPIDCAKEWAEEARRLNLQINELKAQLRKLMEQKNPVIMGDYPREKMLEDQLEDANRLNGELREALEIIADIGPNEYAARGAVCLSEAVAVAKVALNKAFGRPVEKRKDEPLSIHPDVCLKCGGKGNQALGYEPCEACDGSGRNERAS